MSTQRIVIVGASLAGLRGAEAMRRAGFRGGITVLDAERQFPPYDRPPLSKQVLTGEWQPEAALLRAGDDLELDLRLGQRAEALDLRRREVRVVGGAGFPAALPFDGLMIATGAAARSLGGRAVPEPDGVFTLRTMADCLRLRARLAGARRVVVVGAGFIGCEVAASCRALGLQVTLVDALASPMERVIGPVAGRVLAGLHSTHGVTLLLGRQVAGLSGRDEVTGVLLADGELVKADAVVVAIGVTPGTGWLAGSSLQLDDGLLCDQNCFALGTDRVVAAGDVARWQHPLLGTVIRVEHWTNAVSQAQAAARNLVARLTGRGELEAYADVPYFWSDQYDWKLQFAGLGEGEATIDEGNAGSGKFLVCYRTAGMLIGVLCVNWPARFSEYRRMVAAAWKRHGSRTGQHT